jgi:protein TonB
VAEGMLIHKTEPVYPRFAKDNHISGTVVLKAKIGKNGLLQDLRVVSGPKLLGSAALDAAKSWKYRPYMLNNQPVDVDTSISVVFSLGRE